MNNNFKYTITFPGNTANTTQGQTQKPYQQSVTFYTWEMADAGNFGGSQAGDTGGRALGIYAQKKVNKGQGFKISNVSMHQNKAYLVASGTPMINMGEHLIKMAQFMISVLASKQSSTMVARTWLECG